MRAAVMEELVEDDICILNHEKADNAHKRDSDIPVPSYSGDESVASHFALVTAYEDIKKRLKETEKENSFLKKKSENFRREGAWLPGGRGMQLGWAGTSQ